jgi:hypothetical protein
MQRGRGFKSFIGKIGNFLKKTRILSRAAPFLGAVTGNPGVGAAVGGVANALGFGRRRRRGPRRARKIMGGAANYRTAQLLGVSQPNRRISRLSRAM